jgi:micrococcal nuclease
MKLGLWLAAAALAGAFVVPRTTRGDDDCDPSYPEVCLPSPPPDLDCADLRARGLCDVAVRGRDPHRLDRDGDGVACECR